MPTRKETYRETYYPVQRYGEILEETQGDVAENEKLLIAANANLARLAEIHRPPRGLTPQQAAALAELDRTASEGDRALAAAENAGSSYWNSIGNKAVRAIEDAALTKPGEVAGPTGYALGEKTVGEIGKGKGLSSDAAKAEHARKAMVAIERAGGELRPAARDAQIESLRIPMVKDKASLNQYLANPEFQTQKAQVISSVTANAKKGITDDPAYLKANAERDALASVYEHGGAQLGLSAEDKRLRDLFVEELREDGEANVEDFASEDEFKAAEAAYKQARQDSAYLKGDRFYYQEDYLKALNRVHDLESRMESEEGFDDPYLETRRLAFERGGYTREDVLYIAARNKPTQEYVRPAFRRMESDLTPVTEIEKIADELMKQNPDLKASEFEKLFRDERKDLLRENRSEGRESRKGKSSSERQGSRAQGRESRSALRDTYSKESISEGITYVLARKLYREPEGQEALLPLTGNEPNIADNLQAEKDALDKVTQDHLTEQDAALAEAEAAVSKAEKETLVIPEEVKETLVIPEEDLLAGVDLSKSGPASLAEGETIVEAPQAPAPVQAPAPAPVLAVGDVGYEFTDKGDGSRYRRTEDGFVALSGPYAGRKFPASSASARALNLAEREDYAGIAALQRQRAPVVQAPEPVEEPAMTREEYLARAKAVAASVAESAPAPAPAPIPVPAPAPVEDPFARLPGESDADFAARVRELIQ